MQLPAPCSPRKDPMSPKKLSYVNQKPFEQCWEPFKSYLVDVIRHRISRCRWFELFEFVDKYKKSNDYHVKTYKAIEDFADQETVIMHDELQERAKEIGFLEALAEFWPKFHQGTLSICVVMDYWNDAFMRGQRDKRPLDVPGLSLTDFSDEIFKYFYSAFVRVIYKTNEQKIHDEMINKIQQSTEKLVLPDIVQKIAEKMKFVDELELSEVPPLYPSFEKLLPSRKTDQSDIDLSELSANLS